MLTVISLDAKNVRFWGKSGHALFALHMSAFDPKRTSSALGQPETEQHYNQSGQLQGGRHLTES